jgi:hypothetical protein
MPALTVEEGSVKAAADKATAAVVVKKEPKEAPIPTKNGAAAKKEAPPTAQSPAPPPANSLPPADKVPETMPFNMPPAAYTDEKVRSGHSRVSLAPPKFVDCSKIGREGEVDRRPARLPAHPQGDLLRSPRRAASTTPRPRAAHRATRLETARQGRRRRSSHRSGGVRAPEPPRPATDASTCKR